MRTISFSVEIVMFIQGPCLHQLEDGGGTWGHQGHHLPEAGPFHLAGLAAAVFSVRWAVEAGQDLEVGLILAGGVSLGVAAAGLRAVADLVLR